jgi:hypothetical protein
MKLKRVVGAVGGLLLLCTAYVLACLLWTVMHSDSLNRGLAEEKSYFKHAGTYYQLRPELRGQKGNLETWEAVQPGFGVSNVRSGEFVPSSDGIAEIYYERISNSARTL